MGKLILFFLISLSAHAIVPENIFRDDNTAIEIIVHPPMLIPISQYSQKESLELFGKVYADPEKRINEYFKIPDYFKADVNFWFNIYTLYGTGHVILHDKDNLSLVYDVLNFNDVVKYISNIHTKSALQSKMALDKTKDIKSTLIDLSNDIAKTTIQKDLEKRIIDSGIKIPTGNENRKKFFLKLANNIRAQTGQRSNILNGLKAYQSYETFINNVFTTFEIPVEVRALPFLESSFNSRAFSKVGAAGAYQFMPRVGKHYMTIDNNKDERLNALISTVSAAHLLKDNLKMVGRWDLAITAYNSGVKHILEAKKTLNRPDMSLQDMLELYDHAHIGFASKNFYSEFLALVYALAYKDEIYLSDPSFIAGQHLNINKDNLNIYISLCSLTPSNFAKTYKVSSPDIAFLNKQFFSKKLNNIQKKGALFVSDINLNSKKFRKVSFDEMKSRYPKNWHIFAKNQSCSTK